MGHDVILPFGVFLTCCALQFWLLNLLYRDLRDRHPRLLASIPKGSVFTFTGVWKFVDGGSVKTVADETISRRVRALKMLRTVAIVAWLFCVIAVFCNLSRCLLLAFPAEQAACR
jgi:hypothetical protein